VRVEDAAVSWCNSVKAQRSDGTVCLKLQRLLSVCVCVWMCVGE
jgi:hypothetical protein